MKLSVTSSFKDTVTGDVVSVEGFERNMDGKTLRGRSVDWYAKAFDSRTAAFQEISKDISIASAGPVATPLHLGPTEDRVAASEPLSTKLSSKLDERITGTWRWRVDGDPTTGGLLVLASDQGIVTGASISEVAVEAKESELSATRAVIITHQFIGEVTDHMGEPTLRFSIHTNDRTALSSANPIDANSLRGETTQTLSTGEVVTYKWRAERVF